MKVNRGIQLKEYMSQLISEHFLALILNFNIIYQWGMPAFYSYLPFVIIASLSK